MSDWDIWGGKKKTKTTPAPSTPSPGETAGDEAAQLRLKLARALASGDWEGMQGYIDQFLIPRTMNAMTAGGLGRSGAVGEALAQAQMQYGGDFLKTLLTGIPVSSGTPGGPTQTSQYQPGIMDWLSMGLGVAGAMTRK